MRKLEDLSLTLDIDVRVWDTRIRQMCHDVAEYMHLHYVTGGDVLEMHHKVHRMCPRNIIGLGSHKK